MSEAADTLRAILKYVSETEIPPDGLHFEPTSIGLPEYDDSTLRTYIKQAHRKRLLNLNHFVDRKDGKPTVDYRIKGITDKGRKYLITHRSKDRRKWLPLIAIAVLAACVGALATALIS